MAIWKPRDVGEIVWVRVEYGDGRLSFPTLFLSVSSLANPKLPLTHSPLFIVIIVESL